MLELAGDRRAAHHLDRATAPGFQIPERDRAVSASRGEQRAIGREGDAGDWHGVLDRICKLPSSGIPEHDLPHLMDFLPADLALKLTDTGDPRTVGGD